MRTLVILLLNLFSIVGFAQTAEHFETKHLVDIPVTRSNLRNIDANPVADSIWITFETNGGGESLPNAYWIGPDNNLSKTVPFKGVLALQRFNGSIHYYQLVEEKRKVEIKVINQQGTTNFPIDGDILGVVVEKNVFVVEYQEDEKLIIEKEFEGKKLVGTRSMKIPDDVFKYILTTPIVFFAEHAVSNSLMGTSKVKLYRQGGQYYMTVDARSATPTHNRNSSTAANFMNATRFASLESGATSVYPVTERGDFRSYFLGGKIYQVRITRSEAELFVYDVNNQNRVAARTMTRDSTKMSVYERHGKERTVHTDKTFRDLLTIAPKSDPSIYVTKYDDNEIVQFGTFFDEQGAMFIPSIHGLAYQVLLSVLATSVKHTMEGPGLHRYSYLHFNEGTGSLAPVGDQEVVTIRAHIDNFEANNLAKVEKKQYADTQEGVLGTYLTKDKKIRVVSFLRKD